MSTKLKTVFGWAFVLFVGILPITGLLDTKQPSSNSVQSRAKYAFLALLQTGYEPEQAARFVADRLELPRKQTRTRLRKFYRRVNRNPESLRTRYIGVVALDARLNRANRSLEWAICYPLANCEGSETIQDCRDRNDDTFAPTLGICRSRQKDSLSAPLCTAGTSVRVGWGARVRLTQTQAVRLAETRGRNLPAGLVYLNNATTNRWVNRLTQLGLEPCPVQ